METYWISDSKNFLYLTVVYVFTNNHFLSFGLPFKIYYFFLKYFEVNSMVFNSVVYKI